ncbi:MAG: carboxypeptidase regulatory-like domain-containing protein [Saprospiraceae bacterium]|nr:carboxypeptidase regulatory-like domain-containing protein [Saprospiraceae bacterium]
MTNSLNTAFPYSVNSNCGYQYIYSAPPNPLDLCDNFVSAYSVCGSYTWTPNATALQSIGGQFVPGVTYYYVFASYYIQNILNYSVTFTHNAGGQVLSIQNPADAPECKFLCYDIDVVKRETVGMLYNIPGQNQNKAKLTTPPGVADCGDVKVTFEDRITPSDCGDTKLIRDWTATDGNGNKSTCSQTFTFKALQFSDLTPPAPELHLTCGLETTPQAVAGYTDEDSRTGTLSAANIGAFADDYSATPTVVELNEGFANAYFTFEQIGFDGKMHPQKVDPSRCNIYTTYHDDFFPACGNGCGGNMKVVRTWKLLDWCTRETTEYIQVIKAVDEKAPSFGVKDVTVSVDPWECAANYSVEKPWELNDNCAKPEELKWGIKVAPGVEITGTQPNYRISGLTKGVHSITYWAEDCCGNYTEKSADIYVIDASGPIPVAKQNIVLSLTGSGTGTDGAAKIYGWQIDNGSYDQCSEVRFEVRRVDGGSCGNVGANGTHNNNSTYNDNNGYPSEVPGAVWFHPQDNAQDSDGGEFVKFCCEDIPDGSDFGLHDVELRVWDDGNMNGIYGDNDIIDGMKDNYNTTWVTIRVENKLPPALICPSDVTVTCDMELNLSLDAETNVNDVNLTMTGYPQANDLCSNLEVTYKDQWVGSHDPVCKSGTIRRTFKVTKGAVVVTCSQFITVATLTAPFSVTFPNQNQTTEWDKCSFTLDDAKDAANSSIKRPIVNFGQCDIVGENIKIDTFLFEDGACKKWKVTYSYKNWCTGEEINTIAGAPIVHWYAFKDVTAPVLSCTNQMFAANPNPQNPNGGCEAAVALEASASDLLICAEESWIKWQMFFDGWNDGTVDRLGSSFVNKSWNGIWVPQAKYISGVLNPTWVALQNQHPNLPLADLVYVTYIKPTAASGGTAKLPVGTGATAFILNAENISHKVLWKVTDGCGNVDQCESTVMVVDKKAPTPYCVSVSTALMQTNPQMVELWARDFDKGAFDNCTPQSKLYFTFDGAAPIYSRVNEEHFYKVVGGVSVNATQAEYLQGKAYKWLPSARSAGFVWTAAGDYNVQVNVWDEAWNTDYCSIVLSVREGTASIISGTVATASGKGVSDVTVILESNAPEFPKSTLTDQDGVYRFDVLTGNDYQVKAEKNNDYLNGVSTLDLVLIQRHILGLQALDGNFNLIAADANNDGKVTASDLTDLRKLILGITPVLQNNGSWRFVAEGTVVQTSPIAFIEAIDFNNLNSVMDNQDFVGVKIGDVNRSVSSDVNSPEVESRSNANVEMGVAEASIAAGEVVEIPVTAANFSEVMGFQYTMNLNGASFVGVQSGVLEVHANNIGVISDKVITMSYASTEAINANEGAVLFTLTVKADKAMKVSEMISLNSEVTRAESYNSDLKVGRVSLGVRTAPVAGIELFQNEPNPFKGMTTVSFEMPVASTATLSVHDVTGKVVTVTNINAIKGLNSEIFTKDQLGVSGVLYYTLVSGDYTATKKMIIVE